MNIEEIKQTQARSILNDIKQSAELSMLNIMKSLLTTSDYKNSADAIIAHINDGGRIYTFKIHNVNAVHLFQNVCEANQIPYVLIDDMKDNSKLCILRDFDHDKATQIAYQIYLQAGSGQHAQKCIDANPHARMNVHINTI